MSLDCSRDWMWQQSDVQSSLPLDCSLDWMWQQSDILSSLPLDCSLDWMWQQSDVLSSLPVLCPCSRCLALGPCVALFASPAPHPNSDVHPAPGEKVARVAVSQHLFNDNVVRHTCSLFPVTPAAVLRFRGLNVICREITNSRKSSRLPWTQQDNNKHSSQLDVLL